MTSNRTTAIVLTALVIAMFALAFAAVPLYQLFCQKTGFGGTTQVAEAMPSRVLDRRITVRFVADVNPDLPWSFEPLQKAIEVRLGEEAFAIYQVTNQSDHPVTGMATYNVTPHKAAAFFHKIECFCFLEQTLQPGQSLDMPLLFFVDPEMAETEGLEDVSTITLSYTFFPFQDASTLDKMIKLSPLGQR